jgi:2-polyprenyl-3-methyl-5-hydroxy-6-metoxy-1,4-benzoquinol methylase
MSRKQLDLFEKAAIDYRKQLNPSRTAMRRREASPIARQLVEKGILNDYRIASILDYGCGVGIDVHYYRSAGFAASGYDQYEPFGWTTEPATDFDLVCCLFVLNVIARQNDRLHLAQRLVSHTKHGGYIVVATRSPKAIESEAKLKEWVAFEDGYLSSPAKGTFQRGISQQEIVSYFKLGSVTLLDSPFEKTSSVCVCFLQRN